MSRLAALAALLSVAAALALILEGGGVPVPLAAQPAAEARAPAGPRWTRAATRLQLRAARGRIPARR